MFILRVAACKNVFSRIYDWSTFCTQIMSKLKHICGSAEWFRDMDVKSVAATPVPSFLQQQFLQHPSCESPTSHQSVWMNQHGERSCTVCLFVKGMFLRSKGKSLNNTTIKGKIAEKWHTLVVIEAPLIWLNREQVWERGGCVTWQTWQEYFTNGKRAPGWHHLSSTQKWTLLKVINVYLLKHPQVLGGRNPTMQQCFDLGFKLLFKINIR